MIPYPLHSIALWCFGIAFLIIAMVFTTFLYLAITHLQRKRRNRLNTKQNPVK